jgi:hypothetical protein
MALSDRDVAAYFGRTLHTREPDDIEFIVHWADSIASIGLKHYLVIPCHVSDLPRTAYLSQIEKYIDRSILVIFFLNCEASDVDNAQNLAEAALQQSLFDARCSFSFLVIYRAFIDKPTIGRIRGLITDAAALAALMQRNTHAFIIHNDSDTLLISKDYFTEILSRCCETTTFICGPIYFGYKGKYSIALPIQTILPELYLFNVANDAVNTLARQGLINFEKRIWGGGANFAVSVKAYCAVGGFDYGKVAGEDDAIMRALHKYNPSAYGDTIVGIDNVYKLDSYLRPMYLQGSWIATDPRRVLKGILTGSNGTDAWTAVPFAKVLGSSANTEALSIEYIASDAVIQAADVYRAAKEPESEFGRSVGLQIYRKILEMGRADFRIRNLDQLQLYLARCGIIPLRQSLLHPEMPGSQACRRWDRWPLARRIARLAPST